MRSSHHRKCGLALLVMQCSTLGSRKIPYTQILHCPNQTLPPMLQVYDNEKIKIKIKINMTMSRAAPTCTINSQLFCFPSWLGSIRFLVEWQNLVFFSSITITTTTYNALFSDYWWRGLYIIYNASFPYHLWCSLFITYNAILQPLTIRPRDLRYWY